MSGSLNHIVDEDGEFRMDHLDNMGDAREALEQCFSVIYALSGGRKSVVDRACAIFNFPNIKADMKPLHRPSAVDEGQHYAEDGDTVRVDLWETRHLHLHQDANVESSPRPDDGQILVSLTRRQWEHALLAVENAAEVCVAAANRANDGGLFSKGIRSAALRYDEVARKIGEALR